jgi:hypothetical protein
MSNMISLSRSTCPKCGGPANAEPYLLMSNPPQQSLKCANQACKHSWLERIMSTDTDAASVTVPMPNATDTHCTHEGRSFLKPCPVCALEVVRKERDEMRAEAYHFRVLLDAVRESGLVGGLCPCCQNSKDSCNMAAPVLKADIDAALDANFRVRTRISRVATPLVKKDDKS